MTLVRPRLNDYFNLPFTQEEVDFTIPFLDEDIPLYVDPFLLWKSPSQQDNSLHTAVTNSFNHLGYLFNKGNNKDAINNLIIASECVEVGLGDSKKRIGKPIGETIALEILSMFQKIPQISKSGFTHFEEIQLLVDQVSKDRVSDITCSFIKSFLIDYTIEQCQKLNIPIEKITVSQLYDYKTNKFIVENTYLPINPQNGQGIIFVPKRWLRFLPWINYDDYFDAYSQKKLSAKIDPLADRVKVLLFNRQNYDVVQVYTGIKERQQTDCNNDPLFKPIPIISAKRKLSTILSLNSGKDNNADKIYEDTVCQILASLFYPQLDFADEQSRTDSGVLIRDLIFYNNRSFDFLKDIYDEYESRQIVFELKNVATLKREHINQLNRYLKESFGRFGVIVTRNIAPKNIYKNTIDLWSGQRKCIIILSDDDLKFMYTIYESRQRLPIEIIKKKYIEFTRNCPS